MELNLPLPETHHTARDSALDHAPDRFEVMDGGSSDGSESGCLDATESVVSQDDVSEITGQTEATTVDDDDAVGGANGDGPILDCDKQDQDMCDLHPRASPHDGPATIGPAIHFSGQPFGEGEVIDTETGPTWTATYRGRLPMKLDLSAGPTRRDQQLGTSDTHAGTGKVNASWKRPEDSRSEAEKVIEQAKRLGVLPDPATGGHPRVTSTPPHGTREAASGPPTPASGASGSEPPPTGADAPNAVLSAPSAARQARLHLTDGEIHRMMPRGRRIHFDVDTDSFANPKIPPRAVAHIVDAARAVAELFTAQDLGISFAYAPGAGARRVFRIRYDPHLYEPGPPGGGGTLAQSFFPCDPPEERQVRVSLLALSRAYGRGGHPRYMRVILAHEFVHVLGFRHWHAGFDAAEAQVPSLLWPGTADGDWDSIMYTPVHSRMGFSEEDFRVIQEVYSEPDRAVVGGCLIVDVDPYDGRYVL